MKRLFIVLISLIAFQSYAQKNTTKIKKNIRVFELSANQSMCITGKGIGQDAANNPYNNEDSFAVVKNIGKTSFSVRIQNKNKITKEITIKPKEQKSIKLLKGNVLFLDSVQKSKADVTFMKNTSQKI